MSNFTRIVILKEKNLKISGVRCNFVKIDIHFLGLPRGIFFGVTTDDLLHQILALEKCKKECTMLQIIRVQDFGPLKIKITQCPDGFCLKFF